MQYRELGRTGLKISAMGFGGIPIQRIDAEGTRVLMHKLMENVSSYSSLYRICPKRKDVFPNCLSPKSI